MQGFSVSALVLGIVATVLSFMPIVNNLTAAGGAVGGVLGLIAVFRSRRWMPVIGIGLCSLGMVLTVVAQVQLSRELDQIEQEFNQDMEDLDNMQSKLNEDLTNCAEQYAEWEMYEDPPTC